MLPKEDENGVFLNEFDVLVRRSVEEDASWLAKNLSQSDIDEAWALSHRSPENLLEDSLLNSTICWTIEHAGKIVGIFGVMPIPGEDLKGTVWFVATDEIKNMGRVFMRRMPDFVALMLTYYPTLENYVHSKNTKSILWMKVGGATIEEAKPYGVDNELFHRFEFKANNVAKNSARGNILALEEAMMKYPQAMVGDCFPLRHFWASGVYMREISIPKGMVLVSKIHKCEHPVFVTKGEISVYTEQGIKRIKAPAMFMSPAGAKRIGVTHEDTIWVTVHATNETDLVKLEEELIAKNYKEIDDLEIQKFVTEALCHS